jgi:hypothetical protein
MGPFLYPKSLHKRRLAPGPFKSYKKYKPYLRDEFHTQCVYCRLPDALTRGADSFGTDHYRPVKWFKSLKSEYVNLFYCCNSCNRLKGDYWPLMGKAPNILLPNPCDFRMADHIRYAGATVVSRSKVGDNALIVFDFNDPAAVTQRRLMIDAIKAIRSKRATYSQTRGELRKRLKAAAAADRARLANAVARYDSKIGEIDANLVLLRAD